MNRTGNWPDASAMEQLSLSGRWAFIIDITLQIAETSSRIFCRSILKSSYLNSFSAGQNKIGPVSNLQSEARV